MIDLSNYPELLTSSDLVKLGIFSSVDSAYLARARGQSPDYIQFKRKVLYTKASVLRWLQQNSKPGSKDETTQSI